MSDFDEQTVCPECGYSGEMDETENPEHLWGVIGQFTTVCPECGASLDDLFA